MKARSFWLLIRILALPTTATVSIYRAIRSARNALKSEIRCKGCGASVQLVRGWRCSCGFTYVGHLLMACTVCGTRPLLVRCQDCGVTWKIR